MLDVLFLQRSGEDIFYAEPRPQPEAAQENEPSPLETLAQIRGKLKRGYQSLQSKLPMKERLCSNLGHHERVNLHIPSYLPPEIAAKLFLSFLKKCVKTHRRWVVADGVLAALGATLFWIPGPNIFFIYPALRAIGHYYAQAGGGKYREPSGLLIQPCTLLDDFPNLAVPEMMARGREIESRFGFSRLASFLGKNYASQH
ncbi:MAG TPA: hypothetical protein VGQ81_11730 [Acidobacteriota bacterium]|jgi:hypothetical protein|nr:hypothetical protein [Acidobacteriota bacterium]